MGQAGRNYDFQLFFPSVSRKQLHPDASLMKLLQKYPFGTASCEAPFKALQKAVPKGL